LFVDGVLLVVIVTLLPATTKLESRVVPVTTTFEVKLALLPTKDALADTERLPEIAVLVAFPNKVLIVIALLTGVPLGSSTINRRSSGAGVVSRVSCDTFLSAIMNNPY
jgi:hypothetical protein